MPLRRLTALEVDKLRSELATLQETIAELEGILADPKKRWAIIREEMGAVREKYSDDRRSRIVPDEGDLSLEDLIADDELIITVSSTGYVKSVPASTYKTQTRGGRGVKAAEVRDDDVIEHLVHTTAHAYLLFFTNKGLVHRVKAHGIPRQSRTAKGVLAQAILPLEPDEKVQAIIDTRDYETGRYLVMVTKKGQAKKTEFKEYDSRNQTLVAIKLTDDDELVSVRTTNGENDILIFTRDGMGIRFCRVGPAEHGTGHAGSAGDQVEGERPGRCGCLQRRRRRSVVAHSRWLRETHRYGPIPSPGARGVGVKAFKITRVRGNLVAARAVEKDDEVF